MESTSNNSTPNKNESNELFQLSSPILQSLKRPQLVQLAKSLGITANGKNIELIEKLRMHRDSIQSSSKNQFEFSHSTIISISDSQELEDSDILGEEQVEREYSEDELITPYQDLPEPSSSGASGLLRHVSSFRQLRAGERRDIGSSDCALSISATSEQSSSADVSVDDEVNGERYYYQEGDMNIDMAFEEEIEEEGDRTLEAIPTLSNNLLGLINVDNPYSNQLYPNLESDPYSPSQATFPFESASTTPSALPPLSSTFSLIPKGTTRIGQLAPPTPPTPQYFEFGTSLLQSKRFSFGDTSPSISNLATTSASNVPNLLPVVPTEVVDIGGKGKGKGKSTTDQMMDELNSRMELNRTINSTINGSERLGLVDEFGNLSRSTTLFSIRDGLSRSTSGMNLDLSASSKTKGKGVFDGEHKRNFDKMDSISTHYAAKRTLSQSISNRSIAPSSIAQVEEVSDSSRKRIKLLTASKTFDKPVGDTWNEVDRASLLHSSLIIPPVVTRPREFSFSSSTRTRNPIVEKQSEVVDNKRKLEMAKNRRLGSAASTGSSQLGGGSRRRVGVSIAPKVEEVYKPKVSKPLSKATLANTALDTTSRLFKSTIHKLSTAIGPSDPPVLRVPSTFTSTSATSRVNTQLPKSSTSISDLSESTSNRSISTGFGTTLTKKPCTTSSSTTAARVTKVLPKAEPGWKKFDLQKSPSRPLAGRKPTNSSPAAAPRQPSRRQSSRVANVALLGNVGSGLILQEDYPEVPQPVVDVVQTNLDPVDNGQENYRAIQSSSSSALTAPATILQPSINSLASNIFPSLIISNSSKQLPLIPPSPIKSPFRPKLTLNISTTRNSNMNLKSGQLSSSTSSSTRRPILGDSSNSAGGASGDEILRITEGRMTRGSLASGGETKNVGMGADKLGRGLGGGKKIVSNSTRGLKEVTMGGLKKVEGLECRAKRVMVKKSKATTSV